MIAEHAAASQTHVDPNSTAPPIAATGPWRWSQHWKELLFLHWRVPAANLRLHLPPAVDVDCYEGEAWVSLVAFRLAEVRRRWLPGLGLITDCPELNLRTYVRYRGEPAIFFLSIHAAQWLTVRLARWFTPLPYLAARMSYQRQPLSRRFECQATTGRHSAMILRADFSITGPPYTVVDGTLDAWLLERYALYAAGAHGALLRTVVQHPPWQVQSVDIALPINHCGRAFGLDLSHSPDAAHYSPGTRALVWPFRPA